MTSNSNAFKKIMWGIIISGCHIIISNSFQIIPSFIGYFIIWLGMKELCRYGLNGYFEKVEKSAMWIFVFSLLGWIGGTIWGYTQTLSQGAAICFYLLEAALYADMLNMCVKVLKERNMIREADALRKNRMAFIKVYLAAILLCIVQMVGQAFNWTVTIFADYTILTIMLFIKLWLSMFMQKMSSYEIKP